MYFGPEIANHLWQSTLFAAASMLLTLALRKNPARVRYWLWLAASVKFLVPFSVLSWVGGLVEWRVAASAAPAVSAAAAQIGQSFAPVSVAIDPVSPASLPILPAAAAIAWICGFAAVGASWGTRWRRVRAAMRSATPLAIDSPVPVMSSSTTLEPGVFGIVRPVLLLPSGITHRLTPEQLRAILDHEFCHVRRRDNLAAAIHMAVEALFWFHPLVWWIGARLVEEREKACDEEVVALGNSPRAYAEGIVNVCKYYLQSPLACASGVTGADLKARVGAILTGGAAVTLTPARKLLLAGAATVAVTLPLLAGMLQSPQGDTLKFEVASIRLTKSDATHFSIRFLPGGNLSISHTSLKEIIAFAYNVRDFQVSGGPGWIDADRYDIAAKPDRPLDRNLGTMSDDERRSTGDQFRERTRTLLAERFQLQAHKETREGSVYALVVAKSGPKLKPASGARNNSQRAGGGGGTFHATRWTAPMLAQSLSMFAGRTVVDRTGLTGEYDIDLTWTADGAGLDGPSLFTAIQEQLGLRLDASKGPVEHLVVDRAERPTEN